MKIVIDGAIFGLQKVGGISRVWAEILSGLDESGLTVHLLVPKNSNVEWESLKSSLKHISIHKRRRFRWGKHSFFRDSLYLTWIALKIRPHLWHSSFFVGLPKFWGGRKIITLHDMIPEKLAISAPYDTKMKYLALEDSETILAISKHSMEDLGNIWPLFLKKTKLLYNCVSFKNEKREQTLPYFIFVGKRQGYKNFLPTIEEIFEYRGFDSYHIKLVGGEPLSSEEKSCFAAHGNRVEYYGCCTAETVKNLMAQATLLLFPSLYEGFGMPVLEAFCCEVPVFALNTSSIPEITGESYPLGDPKDISTTIPTMLDLMENRERWIAYGKERAKLFTPEKMIDSLLKIYEVS